MKKTTIVQISLLTATLLLNTGCFFGYFGEQIMVPIEKPSTGYATQSVPMAIPSLTSSSIAVECTDSINAISNCNKGRIRPEELKQKRQVTSGGEVHNLKSIQGQPITIIEHSNGFVFPQYPNKIILLEMFGKNCSHCIKEMPTMNKLRRIYRKDLEVIAIQVEDQMSPSEAKSLIQRHKIHYPIIPGDTATNLQYSVQNTYGWTGILPFTMVIKNGVTEFTYPGSVSYDELNSDIRSILK
ncbi:TlpA family protein disulfide reductase [Patescibacteria group bacterium]|nr:TlpA family protein disulfide reductase [Patescibacteria group bacterium]MBU1957119.1 TlpA family protein disulfide reductase [bacterium]